MRPSFSAVGIRQSFNSFSELYQQDHNGPTPMLDTSKFMRLFEPWANELDVALDGEYFSFVGVRNQESSDNGDGGDPPVDLHRVVEAIEILRWTMSLGRTLAKKLQHAGLMSRRVWDCWSTTCRDLAINLCWENENRVVTLLEAFASKATGQSTVSPGFLELMDMLKNAYDQDTPPALCFNIYTSAIPATSMEKYMQKLECFAAALAERSPCHNWDARFELTLWKPYVTPAIARLICALYNTGLLSVCKHVALDPFNMSIKNDEMAQVLESGVNSQYEVDVRPELPEGTTLTVPDVRRVIDLAHAYDVPTWIYVGELVARCGDDPVVTDAFVAEFASYLRSRNHRGRVDWHQYEVDNEHEGPGANSFMESVLAWKKRNSDAHISVARISATFPFASGLLELVENVNDLSLSLYDDPFRRCDVMPSISKFGRVRKLQLLSARLRSLDLLSADVFPWLEHLELINVRIEDPSSCSRFFDELLVEPRASRFRYLNFDHCLDREAATRLEEVLQTNRVLEHFTVITVLDVEIYFELREHFNDVVFRRLSQEEVRCRAAFISVVEQGGGRGGQPVDAFLVKQILQFSAPHRYRTAKIHVWDPRDPNRAVGG